MQDELQENASMSHAENVAIMIRNQHRKTKPVIRYFFKFKGSFINNVGMEGGRSPRELVKCPYYSISLI